MNDLYQEVILDHAHHPRNFGVLQSPTHTFREMNASCGDMVEFYLLVQDNKILEVKWRGVGCAISTASASIVSEMIQGLSLEEVRKLDAIHVMKRMGISTIAPTREKCLMIPIKAVKQLDMDAK